MFVSEYGELLIAKKVRHGAAFLQAMHSATAGFTSDRSALS